MKIQDQDIFHGAALTQVVEHESFKALNKVDTKYGHYLVNHDRYLFVKYCKDEGPPWRFTFQPDELSAIQEDIQKKYKTYLCIVCGKITICALNESELSTLLDLTATNTQWVRVDVPKMGSMHVSGSQGSLNQAIPHNSFPNKVFL